VKVTTTDYEKKLFDSLDVVSTFDLRDGLFSPFDYNTIQAVTEKAALIDGKWIPKSQLRTDPEGTLYISDWFLSTLRR